MLSTEVLGSAGAQQPGDAGLTFMCMALFQSPPLLQGKGEF